MSDQKRKTFLHYWSLRYSAFLLIIIMLWGVSAYYLFYVMYPPFEDYYWLIVYRMSILFIFGLVIIYIIARRMARPIEEAANAAKKIVAGNYQVQLNSSYKEKELHELTQSFQEMAQKLKQLEHLRTQLLAGVTHELKTPVASISGLVQAVKEGVVQGEEADQFLSMTMKEIHRLQKMVEDLLDFNSFAAGAVQVQLQRCDIVSVIQDIVQRWQLGVQYETKIQLEMDERATYKNWDVNMDRIRFEQIIVNLFNNARDAMSNGGHIIVKLQQDDVEYRIKVQDEGTGIPLHEQQDIFEPYFRGADKKIRVRGLGLGLPYSRIMARSLGGELELTSSSPTGTIVTLVLPKRNKIV